MDMEDRIGVLEREVDAIKSELAVIRHEQLDHTNAVQLNARVSRIEFDIAALKGDVSQLQKDVSQLQKDVVKLMEEVVAIRIEMMRMNTEHSQYATKADVKALEANMKGWMLVIVLSLMTSTFAMVYPLYGPLKAPPVAKPAQMQQFIPLAHPASANLK